MGKAETVQPGLILRTILDGVFSILFAPPCAACGAPLDQPIAGPVCESCWRSIPPVDTPFRIDGASVCRAAGVYAGALSAIVHALKYQRRTSLAAPLAAVIARHCHDALQDADLAVPVPLHRARERARGFNQAALLARALPLPSLDALARIRATPSQTDLPAHRRRSNVKGAFVVAAAISRGQLAGRRVVLVDDVATTGSTLSECAAVLREAGAGDVRAVTAARAV